MNHNTPFRRVVKADMQTGGHSFLKPGYPLGNLWELTLECGHKVTRFVRYNPPAEGERVGRGWYRRRKPGDAKPAPKHVHCEYCGFKIKL